MKKYKKEDYKIPVYSWCLNTEEGAEQQIDNLAKLPFAFRHIAIMADCHKGFGMPIGGVLATKGVVCPNAIGLDIGCGMNAIKTDIKTTDITPEMLKDVMQNIRREVPVGEGNNHKQPQDEIFMPTSRLGLTPKTVHFTDAYPIVHREYEKALRGIGTLGGGNHFIELQKDKDDYIWLMIHSGSRNLGFTVANHYNKIAKEENAKYFSSVPEEYDLAFLLEDSEEGQNYINEMNYCIDFALANRKLMMSRIKGAFTAGVWDVAKDRGGINYEGVANIAHNYAVKEHHFGSDVWIHRKGATLAREGTIGIIPGSQGTASYIVKGKGNKESFESCSHGAGRTMSRKAARENLNITEEVKKLNDLGIIHAIRNVDDLEEAPSAYKDIDVVMKNQEDLVEILVKLTPIAVIKG
jgi:tRNA-splicing ligase RtcB